MASLVGQVLHICLGLTAGQYDKCFFPLRFVWSVKVNDEYLAYRPNFIFLFFLLILLVPYMLSFIRSSFLRISGMMPSRPIYKYQPRSQCSLLPALRSERERKSKTVLSKWVALWPMCTTANDIYLFNLFCTLPTPLAPRQRQYSQCGRGGEVASQILAQVVLLLLPAGRKCHQSLCPTPPLPASSKGSRAKRQTTFSDCASGTPGGGGYSHIWAI